MSEAQSNDLKELDDTLMEQSHYEQKSKVHFWDEECAWRLRNNSKMIFSTMKESRFESHCWECWERRRNVKEEDGKRPCWSLLMVLCMTNRHLSLRYISNLHSFTFSHKQIFFTTLKAHWRPFLKSQKEKEESMQLKRLIDGWKKHLDCL